MRFSEALQLVWYNVFLSLYLVVFDAVGVRSLTAKRVVDKQWTPDVVNVSENTSVAGSKEEDRARGLTECTDQNRQMALVTSLQHWTAD